MRGIVKGLFGRFAPVRPIVIENCPITSSPPLRTLAVGEWPEDPDEVPEWRCALESTAAIYGRSLPAYRTRREFEAHVVLAQAKTENARATTPMPALHPDEAAKDFVAMLRRAERTGEYGAPDIYAAYLDHCTSINRLPCSETVFKMSLERIAGVTTVQRNQTRHGRRHRPTIWIVSAECGEDGMHMMAEAA